MLAIISDVHANLEAFQAVLKDIFSKKISEVICLGDVVGYGPDPVKCLELAKKLKLTLMGNHEEAVVSGAANFTEDAARAIDWTRKQLVTHNPEVSEYLRLLPKNVLYQGATFVHGSPRNPTLEYVLPKDARSPVRMHDLFDLFDDICFVGHTHYSGVIFEDKAEFFRPDDIDNYYSLSDGKAIINVGSVGQPRDGDPRACYVTFDGFGATYHRVEYDYKKTQEKIYAVEDLPKVFGDRLAVGK